MTQKRFKNRLRNELRVMGLSLLLLFAALWLNTPSGLWYKLNSIFVEWKVDREGNRLLFIDREIRWNFDGSYTTQDQLLIQDGFVTVMECYGNTEYRTDKALPREPTLKYWRWGRKGCHLAPSYAYFATSGFPEGIYRNCVQIVIQPLGWFAFLNPVPVNKCTPAYWYPMPGQNPVYIHPNLGEEE